MPAPRPPFPAAAPGLYWLELALQSEVSGATLPWWDWSTAAGHSVGVFRRAGPLAALPDGTGEITVTVVAFNKNDDTDRVLRFKELTLLTYA